jgi:serine protease AprX
MMIFNHKAGRKYDFAKHLLLSVGLLGLLVASLALANADAFTVCHTGADVAFNQYGLTGSGISVAVIDSGVRATGDLAQTAKGGPTRIVANVGFGHTNTNDYCGHGTHIAGIIAGNGAASSGSQCFYTIYGIARQTNIVNVRVLDAQGQGTVSNVIAGIQWVIANKNAYNIQVINLSLGHPVGDHYYNDPLCLAVEAAWKAGIVVVCAAGNNGRLNATQTARATNEGWGTAYGSIQSPGNDPYVITVGAMKNFDGTRSDDRIATYSSRGPSRLDYVMKPDLVAPGNLVVSLNDPNGYLEQTYSATNQVPYSLYTTQYPGQLSPDYFVLSGTSMATPVVAGAVALMLQAKPTLTPDTVKARLMISADKWTQPNGLADPCTYGAGYLNIPAALACKAVPTMSAISPGLAADSLGNVYVDPNMVIWGTGVNGTQVIWGVSGVNNLQVIWGTQVLWGTSANILNASQVLWGQSVWTNTSTSVQSSSSVDLTSTAIYGE